MTLTPRLAADIIRQRLNLPDDSMAAAIMLQIPEALKATGRKIAASPDLRQLLITDPSATTAAIASGIVDLTTPYSSFRFLMEYFDLGLVYLLTSTVVTPVEGSPTAASGTWTFLGNVPHEDEIDVNGVTYTFYIPQISVAGSGSGTGSYAYQGLYNGRRFYNKVGEAVNPLLYSIAWGLDGDGWFITSSAGAILYTNEGEDVETPDLSGSWAAETGSPPEPTVTAIALVAPNVPIGTTANETAANFADTLLSDTDPLISVASYAAVTNVVTGTYRTAGTAGNGFTMVNSISQVIDVSGATFAGGAAAAFRLSVALEIEGLEDLARVRFTTTGVLPTGIASVSTDYYVTDYEPATSGDRGTAASFTISAVSDGSVPNPITTAGSGVLTMTLMDFIGLPLQRLKNPQQSTLPRYLDQVFTYFYIQGNELFILPKTITGSVAFAVPSYPTNLAAMPESEEAERIFLDKLYELVLPAVNDAAQDGEK